MAFSHVALGCLLALLPGPPGVQFEDSYIQLYPVDPTKCKDIDLSRDITFALFTRENPISGQQLSIGDDKALAESNMDWSKPLVVYLHAFFESSSSESGASLKHAYTLRADHNIILVNSMRLLAGPWYPQAVRNTYVVGIYVAQFISYLYSKGLQPKDLHVVGLSLGAQAAGVVGGALGTRRPARITGLDPALPFFSGLPLSHRLDREDADFVDIIHTDAGIFGISAPMGHVDFYVNTGISPQPGCELKTLKPRMMIVEKFFCSHWRSFQLFVQSLLTPYAFPSSPCDPRVTKGCTPMPRGERVITNYMGYGVNPRIQGRFYVETSAVAPYTVDRNNNLK